MRLFVKPLRWYWVKLLQSLWLWFPLPLLSVKTPRLVRALHREKKWGSYIICRDKCEQLLSCLCCYYKDITDSKKLQFYPAPSPPSPKKESYTIYSISTISVPPWTPRVPPWAETYSDSRHLRSTQVLVSRDFVHPWRLRTNPEPRQRLQSYSFHLRDVLNALWCYE